MTVAMSQRDSDVRTSADIVSVSHTTIGYLAIRARIRDDDGLHRPE